MKTKNLSLIIVLLYLIAVLFPTNFIFTYTDIRNKSEQNDLIYNERTYSRVSYPMNNTDKSSIVLSTALPAQQFEQIQYGNFPVVVFYTSIEIGDQLPFVEFSEEPSLVNWGTIEELNYSIVVYVSDGNGIIAELFDTISFSDSTDNLLKEKELIWQPETPNGVNFGNEIRDSYRISYSILETTSYANRTIDATFGNPKISWSGNEPHFNINTQPDIQNIVVLWPNLFSLILFNVLYILIGIIIFMGYRFLSQNDIIN